jgi:hypothetical protein
MKVLSLEQLAGQLALGFRGCLSFWTAGEMTDTDLLVSARAVAAGTVLAVTEGQQRDRLLANACMPGNLTASIC